MGPFPCIARNSPVRVPTYAIPAVIAPAMSRNTCSATRLTFSLSKGPMLEASAGKIHRFSRQVQMLARNLLAQQDPEVWNAILLENQRQEDHIELIASENYASRAVLAAQGSALTNKYA